jgi:hypothetical protein
MQRATELADSLNNARNDASNADSELNSSSATSSALIGEVFVARNQQNDEQCIECRCGAIELKCKRRTNTINTFTRWSK